MSGISVPEIAERPADSSILEVSVVIPCLNEAESIEACVRAASKALEDGRYQGEVVVVDNGSTDGSGDLAAGAGARVVLQPQRGYGNAYLAGLAAARGRYIVMLDADMTYDAGELPRFVAALEEGGDMVLGDRMKSIQPGAMPWLHRHVGNPVLTGLLNTALRHPCERRPLRHARRAAGCPAAARPADDRDGARLGDGDQGREGGARHPPVPDRLPPAPGGVEALDLERRLAAPSLPADPQPAASLPDPGHGDGRDGRADHGDRADQPLDPRPRLGHPRGDRRVAAGRARRAAAGARPLRAGVRRLLHGGAGRLVRANADSATGSSMDC